MDMQCADKHVINTIFKSYKRLINENAKGGDQNWYSSRKWHNAKEK